MRAIALAMAGLTLVTTTACYNTSGIRTSDLGRLNGYTSGSSVELQDWSGRTIEFDADSKLYLVRQNGDRVGGKFERIAIGEGRFVGRTQDGRVINLLVPDVQQASVDKYSRGQTIAGIIMAAVVVIGGIVLLTIVSLDQNGWCGRPTCAQL